MAIPGSRAFTSAKSYRKGNELWVRAEILASDSDLSASDIDEAASLYEKAAKMMDRAAAEAHKALRAEARVVDQDYNRRIDMIEEAQADLATMRRRTASLASRGPRRRPENPRGAAGR